MIAMNTNLPLRPAPRYKRALRWPLAIVALLLIHAGVMVTAAVVASRDPNFVVRPNYYRDAVDWDKNRSAARAAQRAAAVEQTHREAAERLAP